MLPPHSEWARLDQCFRQLLDASEAERATLLANFQQQDPALHTQLLQMLQMSCSPDPQLDPEQLDRHAAWQTLDAMPDFDAPAIGERIGAWRLVRHLGRGGMGEVYEAARADGSYEQQAALKLISSEIDSRDFHERFARERQILALLNHPGIARLLDGGEDARGGPFLVMEFVAGTSIDRYCEAQRADLRTRLALFLQVADAVEHAHRQRIIHRDLKPSNILVTADGQAKLLDFGIAKVLSEESAEPGATRTSLLLTPQYCAPEQVLGAPVDFRSDIYQLGLLLFELLTGQRAQEPVDATPHALLQAVCTDARVLPSTCALQAPTARCEQIGALEPAALARQLRGDLDWIVLKALRQEPPRRYASVQALGDDIRRYLRGAPVQARPETLAYRLGKFMRLHPWGMASTAAAFVLMTAYASTATYLLRENAAQVRIAEQVKSLVLRMFQTANPEQALGRALTAKELLDLSWPLIETETRNQPQVQVELLNTLGETYRQLGDYDQAKARLQRAQQLIEKHPQLPAFLEGTCLRTLGRLRIERGEHAQAEAALLRARQLFTGNSARDQIARAATLKELGYLEFHRGRDATAEPFYLGAIDLYRRSPGDHRHAIADAMERLGMTYTNQAKYAAAAELFQTTLTLQQQLLPEGHPDIAASFANLAQLWERLGRFADAEAHFRKALLLMQRARGSEHTEVATIKNNLARVLGAQGKLAEAEALLLQALAVRRKYLGESHGLVAQSLNDLGDIYRTRGDSAAAEQEYQRALAILPAEHAGRGTVMANLGRLLEARGDLPGANTLYRQATAIRRTRFGNQHDSVAEILQQLGAVQLAQGLHAEAQSSLQEALTILRLHFEPTHPRVVAINSMIDQLERRSGGVGEAGDAP